MKYKDKYRFLVTTPEAVHKGVDDFKKSAKLMYVNSIVNHMRNLHESDKLMEYLKANFALDLDKEPEWVKRLPADQQARIGFERWLEREIDHRTEALFHVMLGDMHSLMWQHEVEVRSPLYSIKQWVYLKLWGRWANRRNKC